MGFLDNIKKQNIACLILKQSYFYSFLGTLLMLATSYVIIFNVILPTWLPEMYYATWASLQYPSILCIKWCYMIHRFLMGRDRFQWKNSLTYSITNQNKCWPDLIQYTSIQTQQQDRQKHSDGESVSQTLDLIKLNQIKSHKNLILPSISTVDFPVSSSSVFAAGCSSSAGKRNHSSDVCYTSFTLHQCLCRQVIAPTCLQKEAWPVASSIRSALFLWVCV